MNTIELINGTSADLGEGPSWDEFRGVLYWVDITGKRIHEYNPLTGKTVTHQLDSFVGAVVPRQSGGLVVALQHGFYEYDRVECLAKSIYELEQPSPNIRFNDGKCDPVGRFWAGTMSLSNQPHTGSLYCLDLDGTVSKKLEDVGISNGLGWSGDSRTMYYIDTPTRCVFAFDYDKETGAIRNRRVIIDVPAEEGWPDGMTVDEEGMLWIAHWGGAQVARWNPKNGKKMDCIKLPVPHVTSCVFGGPHLDELYITTAKDGLSEEELLRYPLSGSLFYAKLKIKGVKTISYCG